MFEMKAILVFIMALVMSVSTQESFEDTFKSFCSVKNFSYVKLSSDRTRPFSFYEFLNESDAQIWKFNYKKSGVYDLKPFVTSKT